MFTLTVTCLYLITNDFIAQHITEGQPTANLTSTFAKTEVNHHLASLVATCRRRRVLQPLLVFFTLGLPLQISSYPNLRCWAGIDSIHWPKIHLLPVDEPALNPVGRVESRLPEKKARLNP